MTSCSPTVDLVDPRTMHFASSPLLRGPKSESCSSPPDGNGTVGSSNTSGFSVIFRPGEGQASGVNPTSVHDPLSLQRYSTHSATRLASINQSRSDDGN